ncbi:MAG TPA: metallophosphoesterase [Terracidiphilus sp.]|nr:metallophosphoesterase [Terracidiphilus sp.]
MKVWPLLGLVVLQVFLLLGHWFLFLTIVHFLAVGGMAERVLGAALLILALSFVAAAFWSYRHANALVGAMYKVAAVWLGFLNFLFWAACLCRLAELGLWLAGKDTAAARETVGVVLFGLAVLAGVYGLVNARRIRERRVTVSLPGLPEGWRGRTALLLSDLHLGHVNGAGFAERIAGIARRLNPDAVFIAGDLYDGSKVDARRLAGPLFTLEPPLGMYFCGGNHEDFGDAADFERTLRGAGIRVLHNERVNVDGLEVIGVSYRDSVYPMHLRTFLDGLSLNGTASVLLNHVPSRLPIVEQAGVTLQLSGHTHGGQIVPFTWLTRRAFGKYTYGLQRFGRLQVLTSSGAGTWGPPMRVGSEAEVVLITFAGS